MSDNHLRLVVSGGRNHIHGSVSSLPKYEQFNFLETFRLPIRRPERGR